MRWWLRILLLASLFVAQLAVPVSFVAAPADWPLYNGHFFTQTGGKTGGGFAVTDDGGIPFWTAFREFGGVEAVGYPISHRFTWEGFTVQAFQRVVFQWNPQEKQMRFVNVFDRLGTLGHDDWLLATRQTPKPVTLDEQGKSWDEIVKGRLALLDARPALRHKYFAVKGDAIQMNGLPTSAVTDMGNHYALRAQRVVFQEWKVDVPWAKKGEVTVALGGDIAKEVGLFPPEALDPAVVYIHPEDKFRIHAPSRWKIQPGVSTSRVILAGPIEGKGASPSVTVIAEPQEIARANLDLFVGRPMPWYKPVTVEQVTIAGLPATKRVYTLGSRIEHEMIAIQVSLVHGTTVYTLNAAVAHDRFPRHAHTFDWILASFVPPR